MPPLKGEVPAKQAEGFANADLGRFSVWRPMVVDRMRGSEWQSALPTGSKWVQAQPAGAAPSEAEEAKAARQSAETLRIRRIRELQSMVPEFVDRTGGSKVGAGPACSALPTRPVRDRRITV